MANTNKARKQYMITLAGRMAKAYTNRDARTAAAIIDEAINATEQLAAIDAADIAGFSIDYVTPHSVKVMLRN